jgi:hypothetical protein
MHVACPIRYLGQDALFGVGLHEIEQRLYPVVVHPAEQ